MSNTTKFFLGIFVTATLCGLVFYLNAQAFNGPTSAAGVGNGAVGVGTPQNISIGTSTASSSVNLLIIGSTTDSSAYGLEILNSALSPLLTVRNDGVVSVGTSTISGGSFAGTVSAGNISSGQFGSNTGGGNYNFPANVTVGSSLSVGTTTTTSTFPIEVVSAQNNDQIAQFLANNLSQGVQIGYNEILGIGSNAAVNLMIAPKGTGYTQLGSAGQFTGIAIASPSTTLEVNGTSTFINGNVGIGTTTPGAKLEVAGNILFDNTFGIEARNSVGNVYNMLGLASNNAISIGASTASLSATTIYSGNNQSITFTPNGTGNVIVTNGNVGIGTTVPSSTLHVAATTSSTIEIGAVGTTGCLKMHAASGTVGATIWVYFDSNAVMYATTTKPNFCD